MQQRYYTSGKAATVYTIYLCRGDGDLDLATTSAHQGAVRVDDLYGIIETSVLGQGIKKVLGQVVVFAGGQHLLDTLLLLDPVDGGVLQELAELAVLLDNTLDLLQVGLNSIQGRLLRSRGVECSGVATLNAVEDKGDLQINVKGKYSWM
jgi:hypothetical protein